MGLINLLLSFFEPESNREKLIFISFPEQNARYRDLLVAQSKNSRSPFEFTDMSVKQPWKHNEWKRKCRAKIKRCDGMIALLSNYSYHAGGARWEIKCAIQEGIPVIGMHIHKEQFSIPPELKRKKVITWSWNNLEKFINSL